MEGDAASRSFAIGPSTEAGPPTWSDRVLRHSGELWRKHETLPVIRIPEKGWDRLILAPLRCLRYFIGAGAVRWTWICLDSERAHSSPATGLSTSSPAPLPHRRFCLAYPTNRRNRPLGIKDQSGIASPDRLPDYKAIALWGRIRSLVSVRDPAELRIGSSITGTAGVTHHFPRLAAAARSIRPGR